MRIISVLFLAIPLWAASQAETAALAENARLRAYHAEDLATIEAMRTAARKELLVREHNGVALSDLGSASKKQAFDQRNQTEEIKGVIADSADSTMMQIEELKASKPINSVTVWLAGIGLLGTFLATLGTIILALVNHRKVDVVSMRVNGAIDRIAALSEIKGRAEMAAEIHAAKSGGGG